MRKNHICLIKFKLDRQLVSVCTIDKQIETHTHTHTHTHTRHMLCFGSVRSLSFDCMQKRRALIGCFRNQMCNKFRVEQDYHQWHWRVRQSYGPKSLLARPICRKWRDRIKRKKRQWEGAEFRQRCRNPGYIRCCNEVHRLSLSQERDCDCKVFDILLHYLVSHEYISSCWV